MAQTYNQLKKQIADLQEQAEGIKRSEVAGVITKAKEAIRVYGLTRQDLFDAKASRATPASKGPKGKKAKSSEAKYADGKGGQWVGRGKRPKWLSEALAAGRKLEDFLEDKLKSAVETFSSAPGVVATPVEKAAPKTRRSKAKQATVARRASVTAKYQDGAGNTWSGFGPRPKWLKEGLAGGKKLEDFLG